MNSKPRFQVSVRDIFFLNEQTQRTTNTEGRKAPANLSRATRGQLPIEAEY